MLQGKYKATKEIKEKFRTRRERRRREFEV
jgi:hypothetical protein